MAQVSIGYEVKMEGLEKLVKTVKKIDDFYIKDLGGKKNRVIVEKMRQKLMAMLPGAKISTKISGKDMEFKISNIRKTNGVTINRDKLALDMSNAMDKFQGEAFLEAEEK